MKKDLVLQSVQDSVSSIFTKENVITLINLIEEGSSRKITTLDIQRAIDKTINWIDNNERDVVDLDSAEFEISYNNQLECVGIQTNTESIREILENNFMDFGEEEDEVSGSEFVPVEENEL
jgi:hypothetical protein